MKKRPAKDLSRPIFNTSIKNVSKERWKDMPDFEDLYQISNYGRVKSLARWINRGLRADYYRPERIIKLRITTSGQGKQKYIDLQVKLHKDSKRYMFSVARYVYYLFVAPFDLSDHSIIITRKDSDKLNCYYRNLALRSISDVAKEGFVESTQKRISAAK
jgi:hypothetical protein